MNKEYILMCKEADFRIISLTQNQVTIIDSEDFERVNKLNWSALKRNVKYKDVWVAVNTNRNRTPRTMYLSRFIMNAQEGDIVDHINGDTLDNRKANLRIVTQRENAQNRHNPRSSIFPGVTWDIDKKEWKSSIKIDGKSIHLGSFIKEEDAAKAYDWAYDELKKGNKILSLRKKTSKYKGVHWDSGTQKWRAMCTINGKRKHLGLFTNEHDAFIAYQNAKGANLK